VGNFIEVAASPEIQEIAIITGASTGVGAATACELARRGFHVLAGVRRDRDADAIRGPGVEPLIVDITNPGHIRALATRVHGDPQGRAVRALVNNAAIGVNAPVEAFAIGRVATPVRGQPLRPHRRYPVTPAGPDPQQGIFVQTYLFKYTVISRESLRSRPRDNKEWARLADDATRSWLTRQVNTICSLRRGNNGKARLVTWSLILQVVAIALLSVSVGLDLHGRL
jgi:hypothetical protein